MTQTLTRTLLYTDPVAEFARKMTVELPHRARKFGEPVNIRDFTLEEIVKHTQTVGADDSLITAKVVDTVIRGAEEDENLWRRAAAVFALDTEIQRKPLITPDDFLFADWIQGTKPRSSGGAFFALKFDCSNHQGHYAADVGFTKNDLKAGGFDKMEEALWCSGQAAGRFLLKKVVVELLTDVNSGMTDTLANWGNGAYKALNKMEGLIAKQGMSAGLALVNPAEGTDIANSDYFIHADYGEAARGIPKDLHSIGSLYGRIPILRHRDVTENSMIMLTPGKSVGIGLYQDIQVESYEDIREGLEGAVVSFQFDVKSGKDAEGPSGATSPVAKSWAVCTSA